MWFLFEFLRLFSGFFLLFSGFFSFFLTFSDFSREVYLTFSVIYPSLRRAIAILSILSRSIFIRKNYGADHFLYEKITANKRLKNTVIFDLENSESHFRDFFVSIRYYRWCSDFSESIRYYRWRREISLSQSGIIDDIVISLIQSGFIDGVVISLIQSGIIDDVAISLIQSGIIDDVAKKLLKNSTIYLLSYNIGHYLPMGSLMSLNTPSHQHNVNCNHSLHHLQHMGCLPYSIRRPHHYIARLWKMSNM